MSRKIRSDFQDNRKYMRTMPDKNYLAYIFDVDGTLYSQRKMRLRMCFQLLKHFIFHPNRLNEIYVIFMFRRIRAKDENKDKSISYLCTRISERTCDNKEKVKDIVQRWMFERPLMIIKECEYRDLTRFIRDEHNNGKKIFFYSDYPAYDKIMALGIPYNEIFTAEDEFISTQKPNKYAMKEIIRRIGINKSDILYVGDRYDKDGVSAEYAGIDYLDVGAFRKRLLLT